MTKPILRWAGSKRQLVPHIAAYWPGGSVRYIEPFVGSAGLFFAVQPSYAILGDINAALIETYRMVRDVPEPLHLALKKWINDEAEYYRIRAMEPVDMDPVGRAARFLYLNRFCFNGLYRTNGAGYFNVPYGGNRSGQLPTLRHLRAAGKLLERAKLVSGDFRETLSTVGPNDFVYLDPPFFVSGLSGLYGVRSSLICGPRSAETSGHPNGAGQQGRDVRFELR